MKASIHPGSSGLTTYLVQLQDRINATRNELQSNVKSQNQWLNSFHSQVIAMIENATEATRATLLETSSRKRSSVSVDEVEQPQIKRHSNAAAKAELIQMETVLLDTTDDNVEVVEVVEAAKEEPRRATRATKAKVEAPVRLTRAQLKKLEDEANAPVVTKIVLAADAAPPKRRLGARTMEVNDDEDDTPRPVAKPIAKPVSAVVGPKTLRGTSSRANSRQRNLADPTPTVTVAVAVAVTAPVEPEALALESPSSSANIDDIVFPAPNVSLSPPRPTITHLEQALPTSPGSRFKIAQPLDSDSEDDATPLPYNSSPVFHLQLSQPPSHTLSPAHIPGSPPPAKPVDLSILVLDASQDALVPSRPTLMSPATATVELVTPSAAPVLPSLAPETEAGATRKPVKAMALIASKSQKDEPSMLSILTQKMGSPLSWFSSKKQEDDLPNLEAHSPKHTKAATLPMTDLKNSSFNMFSPVKKQDMSFSDSDEAFLREMEFNMKSTALLDDFSAIGVEVEDFDVDQYTNNAQARSSFEALALEKNTTPKPLRFGKSALNAPKPAPGQSSLNAAADAKKKAQALLSKENDAPTPVKAPVKAGMKFNFGQQETKVLAPASSAAVNSTAPTLLSPAAADKKPQFTTPRNNVDVYAKNLQRMLRETTPVNKKENNFDIMDRVDSDDDDDDEIYSHQMIPDWARSMSNVIAVHRTQLLANPDAIFPPLQTRSCDLEVVFRNYPQRKTFKNRTSSGMWQHDGLTIKDIETTNKTLRIQDYPVDQL